MAKHTALRSRFHAGVYDPSQHKSWPYFHADDGKYLSSKHRICGIGTAAVFETPDEARRFYAEWKRCNDYKLSIREFKIQVEVPPIIYPPDHPRSIMAKIITAESRSIQGTALLWFAGEKGLECSKQTWSRHRRALLKYGIDINEKPTELLGPPPSQDDMEWQLGNPKLGPAK